jgi:hypothetical protein
LFTKAAKTTISGTPFDSWVHTRYIKVKVEHYLLFMFSPPKISLVVSGMKYICLPLLPVFCLISPPVNKSFFFFFQKQNSVLPIVFYAPWVHWFVGLRAADQKRSKTRRRKLKFPLCPHRHFHHTGPLILIIFSPCFSKTIFKRRASGLTRQLFGTITYWGFDSNGHPSSQLEVILIR